MPDISFKPVPELTVTTHTYKNYDSSDVSKLKATYGHGHAHRGRKHKRCHPFLSRSLGIPSRQQGNMHLEEKVNEHAPVPGAKGKPSVSRALSEPKTRCHAAEKRRAGSPTLQSRPRLLRPRGSCHAKGCACTDGEDTSTPHAGDRVMPSPRAT